MQVVSRSELVALLEQGVQLVEVLPEDEFRGSHIPGAINIPLSRLTEEGTRSALDASAGVAVYCQDQL